MSTAQDNPFIVLHDVPWGVYEKLVDALGEYHLRHTYYKGALELRAVLGGVAKEDYRKFLDALGDYNLRHTYDGWSLEMMSPRKDHDWIKRLIGRMIETLAYEFNISIQSIGSTTLTSDQAERGLQPDEAYYVAHELQVRGKDIFEPDVDPPPDLVVEVDVTHSSVARLPVFAELAVPEVWRHDGKSLHFLTLTAEGQYCEADRSAAFPFLTPRDINEAIERRHTTDENSLIRSFIESVRDRPTP